MPSHHDRAGSRVMSGRLQSGGFVRRASPVEISFGGRAVAALEGETVAAALTAAGIRTLRTDDRGAPRGVFCAMGSASTASYGSTGGRTSAHA